MYSVSQNIHCYKLECVIAIRVDGISETETGYQDIYDCDVLLEGMTEKVTTYRFIEKMEGVDAYEYIYTNMSENKINGQKKWKKIPKSISLKTKQKKKN